MIKLNFHNVEAMLLWFGWNKAGIGFEFCDLILNRSVNLSKFLFIILWVEQGTERIVWESFT